MARIVAIWRCKCGTGVKVVAEADSIPAAKQIASCPKCGDERLIHADKIISVTEDTFDGAAAVVSCEEKERLRVAQNKAFDTYRRVVAQLADVAGIAAHADFEAPARHSDPRKSHAYCAPSLALSPWEGDVSPLIAPAGTATSRAP